VQRIVRAETRPMRDFRKLIVWQKSHLLSLDAHRALQSARASGAASVRAQLQRAVASIPANIAEGCGKRSESEFARYLDIALGSAKESENHLQFVHDMGWIERETFAALDSQLTEVRRMLFSLGRVVRSRARNSGGGGSRTTGESGEGGDGSRKA
jgi:four helix bundle protein